MFALMQIGVFPLDVFEAVKTRRSARRYKGISVEKEKLAVILEASRLTPSAKNNQPCHLVMVSDRAVRERLLPAYTRDWLIEAPVIIVACSYPNLAWSRMDRVTGWKVDTAIAVQNMILVAHELSLGTCWVAAFDEAKIKDALGIPNEVRVSVIVPLGYPAEHKGPVTKRKPLGEIVHYER